MGCAPLRENLQKETTILRLKAETFERLQPDLLSASSSGLTLWKPCSREQPVCLQPALFTLGAVYLKALRVFVSNVYSVEEPAGATSRRCGSVSLILGLVEKQNKKKIRNNRSGCWLDENGAASGPGETAASAHSK